MLIELLLFSETTLKLYRNIHVCKGIKKLTKVGGRGRSTPAEIKGGHTGLQLPPTFAYSQSALILELGKLFALKPLLDSLFNLASSINFLVESLVFSVKSCCKAQVRNTVFIYKKYG